jgi:outer membrane receptor for ferrienterochelin and colicin
VNFSKKIHLTAGARYEVSKIFDEAFIPRIALVIKPIQKFTMKAMYAYAFQAPSFFYLYEQFGNVSTIMLPNSKQNFLLNNQKIGTYDFEVSYQHNDIFVSADFFKSTATDLIERRTYTQAVFNPYAGKETSGLRNENIGEQNVIGLMLRTKYQINKKISVSGNYVYTKATFLYGADRAETWVPRISEHKFYAGADFHKIFGILNFTLNWQYFPSITPIAAARAGGKVEGHHFINASLSGMVTKNIRIFAVSQNMLGNKEHTGIFDGGIYSPVLPQAAFRGQIGAEIVY